MVYSHLRENIGLKSQVSCNIPRQVAGTYKTILELIKIGKSKWQQVTYSPTSMTLSYKRDYTITENSVSITTFSSGRKQYRIQNYTYAKRVMKRLSGKEKRLMKDVNHCISKKIVDFALENNVSVIGLEDLTGIRDRTQYKVRKKQRYTHSSWAFRQLQTFIEYKAKQAGILVEYVNPEYTSQTCSRCNHISKNNRKGLRFRCRACGFEMNADLNAARNIEHRTRDFRYSVESQGCLSTTHTN